jgi:3-hydroxyphenylacetate 6-hydroxylase
MLSINFENPSRRSTTELYSIAVLILFAISFLIYESVRWSARIPKFAGPLGVPVYGNLWQIHNKDAPKQYRDWSYKYGPVYQIQLGNIPILIINTAAAAKKILTQNSHATASRPEFYTFHKAWVSRAASNLIRFHVKYITNCSLGYLKQNCHYDWNFTVQ